jgi:hypothetical protein
MTKRWASRVTLARLRSVIVHRLPDGPYSATFRQQKLSGSARPALPFRCAHA